MLLLLIILQECSGEATGSYMSGVRYTPWFWHCKYSVKKIKMAAAVIICCNDNAMKCRQ